MTNKINLILFFIISINIYAQTAIHNSGFMQLHKNVNIGFHTNLVNDGVLENNLGTVGFYSNNKKLTITGSNRPIFNNVDVATFNANLELGISLGVTNDLSFIEGKIITPRNKKNIFLDFISYDFYGGESNKNHIDGYASVKNYDKKFVFPIGDDNRLRPMKLPSHKGNTFFKGAYFFENPNITSTFSTIFNTNLKQTSIKKISNKEFWHLEGNTKTTVTLTWDIESNIHFLTNDLKDLRVVGWNLKTSKWENLGNTKVIGNKYNGEITSFLFKPDDYKIITVGSNIVFDKKLCNANYLISANGDKINDTLTIDCLKDFPENSELSIYNRWGVLVFKAKNYKNNWSGKSYGSLTINKEKMLSTGTYYYVLTNKDYQNLELKGWVYLLR